MASQASLAAICEARFANGNVRAGGQAHQIDGIRQLVDFVEIVDAPDQAAFDVAPGAEIFDVQIADREHTRGASRIRADLGPELHPAIKRGAKERKHILRHGLMFALKIGGQQADVPGEPRFVRASGFDNSMRTEDHSSGLAGAPC